MTSPALHLTAEQAEIMFRLERGRWDPRVWAEDVLGVRLNPSQRRWFSLIKPGTEGWQWRYLKVLHVAANQIGKTLGLAVLILWAAWYKVGVDISNSRWLQHPYMWFHLAPTQPQAYLTLKDIVALLDGSHPAQVATHEATRRFVAGLVSQVKIETYYDGLSLWNGSIIQFRTTDDKAKALQGRRAAGISYDEAAFEDHLTSVVNETLMMRLISTGGPLWLVSTPNGINDWFEIVTELQDNAEPREVITDCEHPLLGGSAACNEPLPIWERLDQREALVWSHVSDNVGFGLTQDAVDRMEAGIDPATKEQQLRGAFLEPTDAFFVPARIIDQAFRADLPLAEWPKVNHKYVISWDPSATTDPTVAIVIDVTQKPWRGVYFKRYEKPLGETGLLVEIYKLHAFYNGGSTPRKLHQRPPVAITVFDSTSMGGSMISHSLRKLTPRRALNLAGPNTKRIGLTDLRAALNTGDLILPKWPRARREILTYKLPDDKIQQDVVMTLLGAVAIAASGWSGTGKSAFQVHGRS